MRLCYDRTVCASFLTTTLFISAGPVPLLASVTPKPSWPKLMAMSMYGQTWARCSDLIRLNSEKDSASAQALIKAAAAAVVIW